MPIEPRAVAEVPLNQLVNRLAQVITRGLPPGDVAALRRMDPNDAGTPAFWKLAGTVLEDELRGEGAATEERERRWATIASALAVTSELHSPSRPLGAALANAGFSELRLARLLNAHADAVRAEVRSVASFLASKAEVFDATDLAALVLSDGRAGEERVRRRIGRSYFGQSSRNDK